MSSLKRDVSLLLAFTCALGGSYAYVRGGQDAAPVFEEIGSPDEWVPFSATLSRRHPGIDIDMGGRFFRGADGSVRLETGPPDRRQAVIGISNRSERRTYAYSKYRGWTALPFPNQNPEKIPRFRVDNVRWFRHPEKIEGYDVLRFADSVGNVNLFAPALNGHALVRQSIDGNREVYTDIEIGPQPAELFSPPPGVAVQEATTELTDHILGRTVKGSVVK